MYDYSKKGYRDDVFTSMMRVFEQKMRGKIIFQILQDLISVKTKCKAGASKFTYEQRKAKTEAYAKDDISLGDPSVPWVENPTWYLAAKLLLNR